MSSRLVAMVFGNGSLPIYISDNIWPWIVVYQLAVDTVRIVNHKCVFLIMLKFGPRMKTKLYRLPADIY